MSDELTYEEHVKAKIKLKLKDLVYAVYPIYVNDEFSEATRIVNDLGFDSLDVFEFELEIESEFKITIPDNASDNLNTIEDYIDYIYDEVELCNT